jgi:hypothetical protein
MRTRRHAPRRVRHLPHPGGRPSAAAGTHTGSPRAASENHHRAIPRRTASCHLRGSAHLLYCGNHCCSQILFIDIVALVPVRQTESETHIDGGLSPDPPLLYRGHDGEDLPDRKGSEKGPPNSRGA